MLETCRNHLNLTILNYYKIIECQTEDFGEKTTCIVIRGDTQQGKTRFLEEFFKENTEENFNCIRLNLKANQLNVSFCYINISFIYSNFKTTVEILFNRESIYLENIKY